MAGSIAVQQTAGKLAIAQTEAQFQRAVIELAVLNGWDWLHIDRSRTREGFWLTAAKGTLSKGWPDLLLIKGNRLIFVELKSEKGKVKPEQYLRLAQLGAIASCYIWRPSDWDAMLEVLAG